MQEGKLFAGCVLQIVMERRQVKGKGERERYTELNVELKNIKER